MSTHKINGQKWRVKFTNEELCVGDYAATSYTFKEIIIRPNQGKRDMLDTIIHEVLHAALPHLTEEAVGKAAGVCTDVIYKNKKRVGIKKG